MNDQTSQDPAVTAGCLVTIAIIVLIAALLVVIGGILIYAGSPGSPGSALTPPLPALTPWPRP